MASVPRERRRVACADVLLSLLSPLSRSFFTHPSTSQPQGKAQVIGAPVGRLGRAAMRLAREWLCLQVFAHLLTLRLLLSLHSRQSDSLSLCQVSLRLLGAPSPDRSRHTARRPFSCPPPASQDPLDTELAHLARFGADSGEPHGTRLMFSYRATGKKHSSSAQSSAWADFRSRRTGELDFDAVSCQPRAPCSEICSCRKLQGWLLVRIQLIAYTTLPCLGMQRNSSASTPTR